MVKPIIKWAGGKTQLLSEIEIPEYDNYYEPFLGGGAVFFNAAPRSAVLNDSNSRLMNMYKQIRNGVDDVLVRLYGLKNEYELQENKADYYYKKRELYNSLSADSPESAALFIFLNKTCFNGLYRENKSGQFNVPFGKRKAFSFDEENIRQACCALNNAELMNGDFEKACENVSAGDFVFFDSPYYDTFDTYQAGGFTENDHLRLNRLFADITNRGAKCVLTNSNTEFIKTLYKDYDVREVSVKRNINRRGNERTGSEIIVKNW